MDSFSHAFIIAIPLLLAGNAVLVPFAVIGAVIPPDIDGVFFLFPDDEPSRYIFTHGGITHSIAGASLLSLVAFIGLYLLSGISWFSRFFPEGVTMMAGLAILAGAMLHILIDYLAYPGIPLFWPFSTEKFTLGIFPGGPSLMILILSLGLLTLILTGRAGGVRHYKTYLILCLVIFSYTQELPCMPTRRPKVGRFPPWTPPPAGSPSLRQTNALSSDPMTSCTAEARRYPTANTRISHRMNWQALPDSHRYNGSAITHILSPQNAGETRLSSATPPSEKRRSSAIRWIIHLW